MMREEYCSFSYKDSCKGILVVEKMWYNIHENRRYAMNKIIIVTGASKGIGKEIAKKLAKKGNSIVYVVKNKEIISMVGVNDIVREEAKEIINNLFNQKIDTIMLTRR